jgi:hypothetical protein
VGVVLAEEHLICRWFKRKSITVRLRFLTNPLLCDGDWYRSELLCHV